jgi:ferredoxin
MSGLGYGSGRIAVVTEADPEAVEAMLYDLPKLEPATPGTFLAMGGRRSVVRLALGHLHEVAPEPVDTLPLAPGAPFGAAIVDVDGCTVCLACVGACPTGAFIDNPDKPQLSFQEEACIQCGLCRNTCPEKVITLEPRFSFLPEARGAILYKEEEPFECIRCGKPFGTKSTIETIVAKLEGHTMFKDEGAIDRIRMCDDCRVMAQMEAADNPFAGPPRPVTRTTEDYLREPEIEEARRQVLEEREKESGDDKD